MKTFTDSTMMPFGKYGPGRGDHRMLKDVPRDYLDHLSRQDWMYHHRELADYIESVSVARTGDGQKKQLPKAKAKAPVVKWKDDSTLRDFLKTL